MFLVSALRWSEVAEWMGRREAWSTEKPSDTRTKPTRWEFRDGREQSNEGVERTDRIDNITNEEVNERRIRSAEDHRRVRIKNARTAKDNSHHSFHNSRTNLINDRDLYIEDVADEDVTIYRSSKQQQQLAKKRYQQQIDDDSMRRHEIDRGSDLDYGEGRGSLKTKREYFIKDGNVEILQLMTREKQNEENIYVNLPSKATNLTHPQLLMVDNTGKEILMRRFIEEQPDGKQIIREHYQIVPGATYIQTMPNEVQPTAAGGGGDGMAKSGPNSVVYSQTEPEVKVIHTQQVEGARDGERGYTQMQEANSTQSLHFELENSLKQQNALLRQILLEKEKLEERYNQQETALETQSLPCQSMAIATQTDCEAGTQTDLNFNGSENGGTNGFESKARRRARSENDDSMSEDEYEYVRFSPPNSPEGVYWLKRKRQKKRSKYRGSNGPRKRIVMVDEVKRKIRTPIREEEEFYEYRKRSPPKKPVRQHGETRTSMLRRMKNEGASKRKSRTPLSKDLLMEISDSLDEKEKRLDKIQIDEVEFYANSDDDSDADEIVIKRNTYSTHNSNEEYSDAENHRRHRFEIHLTDSSNNQIFSRSSSEHRDLKETDYELRPKAQQRLSRKDASPRASQKRGQTSSEPPHNRVTISKTSTKAPAEQKSTRLKERNYQSEHELDRGYGEEHHDGVKGVPKYMEWYYGKKSNGKSGEPQKTTKVKVGKKLVGASEKKINQSRKLSKSDDSHLEDGYKPEPAPRKTPPKGARMLKEDVLLNKHHKPKIETDSNHPLLQHSEHRYEREYETASEIPVPPSKLPHYMYPETPPFSKEPKKSGKDYKQKPSPIKENEIKVTNSKINLYIEDPSTSHNQQHSSKQLNASTLEDDHDSGIAMNSLLNSMGRRNPIAEKKSVFSIAYDDVSRVQKIQSGSDSPQYS